MESNRTVGILGEKEVIEKVEESLWDFNGYDFSCKDVIDDTFNDILV